MTERPKTADYCKSLPSYGALMTVEEYLANVQVGGFIDYDGHGKAVRDGRVARTNLFGDEHIEGIAPIIPSDGITCIPEDATHIVWFNR